MTEPLLRVERVSVARRLAPVSFELAKGQVHAVLGPNGVGKSTLVECLLGLVEYSGSVHLVPSARLAVVPQTLRRNAAVVPTVGELLASTRTARPVCLGLSSSMRTQAARLLERVALAPAFINRPLLELSGGELRKVLLAHALDPPPDLLLLDEPEAGLDEHSRAWLDDQLHALKKQGVAMVLISHETERTKTLADACTTLDGARPDA